MASPKIVIFFIADGAGAGLPGQTPTFDEYQDDLGAPIATPTITDIGGGFYKFTPVFPANRWISFLIDTDTGGNPAKISGSIRPEDYNIDNLTTDTSTLATAAAVATLQGDVTNLLKIETGRWKVHTTGPDANRLVIYDSDDVTPLYKWDLKDSTGTATYVNPFEKVPV